MSYGLPYPDETFDRVFSSLLFHHLTKENKIHTLEEIVRVLRPGSCTFWHNTTPCRKEAVTRNALWMQSFTHLYQNRLLSNGSHVSITRNWHAEASVTNTGRKSPVKALAMTTVRRDALSAMSTCIMTVCFAHVADICSARDHGIPTELRLAWRGTRACYKSS